LSGIGRMVLFSKREGFRVFMAPVK
jgi:hypothetical protein